MPKNYKLIKTSLGSDWDNFNKKSADSTIFSNTNYLESTKAKLGLYQVLNSNEIRAQVYLVENQDGDQVIEDDLVIYSGVNFGKKSNNQVKSQELSERFEILTFLVEAITTKYKKINLSLSPNIKDIRPFQWHNYGNSKKIFSTNIKYTSYLNIKEFSRDTNLNDIECYRNSSSSRRQEIRYSLRDNFKFSKTNNVEIFIRLYEQVFINQGIIRNRLEIDRIRKLLINLLDLNIAHIFCSHNLRGDICSIAVFVVEESKAYYLFGASNNLERNSSNGTHVLWQSFYELAEMGIQIVDLEGVNSPKRGWFKLSFGGDLIPYFNLSYS